MYTDSEGKFSINVPEGNDRLVVSYVGFASQDVSVGNGTVNVSMREDLTLEEVVVTGVPYGFVAFRKQPTKQRSVKLGISHTTWRLQTQLPNLLG